MQIELYYAPTACSLVPLITLTEAGAAFEVHPVNFRAGENLSARYLAINPLHKVPVLVVDGRPLTENTAIHVWIARQFPAARLLPDDPWDHVRAISRMAWCASGVHPHLTRIFAPIKYCDVAGTEESTRRLATAFALENFAEGNRLLAGRDWFFDHFTAVDAYFFWCMRRGQQLGLDLSGLPHCMAHFARMNERKSVRAALDFEKDVQNRFAAQARA